MLIWPIESNGSRQSNLPSPVSIIDDILPWQSSWDPRFGEDTAFVDFNDGDLCFGLNDDDEDESLTSINCKSSNLRQQQQQRMSSAERRQRNNISAKKSRKAKKVKDRHRVVAAKSLENENNRLKLEIQMIQNQIDTLRQIIFRRIRNSQHSNHK